MTVTDNKALDAAMRWASAEPPGSHAQTLAAEINRRVLDHGAGNVVLIPMPADRLHLCHGRNAYDEPTDWIEYHYRYGWILAGTNMYGDGSFCSELSFCPWCGFDLRTVRPGPRAVGPDAGGGHVSWITDRFRRGLPAKQWTDPEDTP